ncbi:MAG: 30S ribosome-binding factor RbfA [Pseudomonadota bacterium]|nr:30S ribosome-binding factor RbfA [Pseudomonadota bacterium]HJO35296.1 30S ribosome-binding factor RbfA [Gammaproteobacteria bacterium]
MPRDFPRSERVAESLRQELSELVRDAVRDPRLGPATVTAVEVSRDLGQARVLVAFLGAEDRLDERLAILNGAAPHLHHQLVRRLRMKKVPQLRFVYDRMLDEAARMDQLIRQARRRDEGPDSTEPADD